MNLTKPPKDLGSEPDAQGFLGIGGSAESDPVSKPVDGQGKGPAGKTRHRLPAVANTNERASLRSDGSSTF